MSGSNLSIFDTQFAVNQFSGNQSLLVQILEKFIKQYQDFDSLILERLQQEDFQTAKQEVHTIKGVSGNLGMKALHHECKELEEHIANKTAEHAISKFLKVLEETLTLVQTYSAENNVAMAPDNAPVEDDKALLIAALKRGEFISDNKMQSFEPSLNLSAEKLTEFKQAIDNLDYVSAIQLLE